MRSEWTPRQVACALDHYPVLVGDGVVGLLRGAASGQSGAVVYVPGSPLEKFAVRKADIERAVKLLPLHQRRVMELYYLQGLHNLRDVASDLRIGVRTACRYKRRGVASVAVRLCGYPSAGTEVMYHLAYVL